MDTYFRTHEEGERRMGKAVTDIALKKKLEHFVRETAQNSADAAVEGETPHLIYRYAKIEDQLPEFLNAIGWDTLKEHYAAVAEEDDEIGIQKIIDRIEKGSLPILVVEDQNAIGLLVTSFQKRPTTHPYSKTSVAQRRMRMKVEFMVLGHRYYGDSQG